MYRQYASLFSEKASFNCSSELDLSQFPTKDLSVKFTLDLELTTGLKSKLQIWKR